MKIRVSILFLSLLVLSAFTTGNNRPITLFMIGDSTMADKNLEGGNPERGWGHLLPGFFTTDVVVNNHAQNGRSSKSFIDEGRWDKVISQVGKGDYVFIQFGHNDEKEDSTRYTRPGTTFDANLKRFISETREKGGIPVLFNSIVRRNFDDNGKLVDTHGAYIEAPRRVAEETGTLFIDLNRLTHQLVEEMGVEASKQLFVWIAPNTVPMAPKGKEDDTHLNVYGAKNVAALAVKEIEQLIPELAEHIRYYDFVVAQDGSGDFFTVQEAINAVPDFRKNVRTTILVREGVYKEKLVIPANKINVSLYGQGEVVLTYDAYADKKNRFGEPTGTSGSASCYIYGPDFYAENITFENSSGPVGQAVACFLSGDRAMFKACRFLGYQDTLYTYGKNSRQYYEDCYIEGTVDFIFGWSTAVFNRCTIKSLRNGYVTAPSTDAGKKYGYVFYDCNLIAAPEVNEVYLSRPWRPYARAVFIRCHLGGHIVPAGWDNWNKKEAEKRLFYAEYESTGEGANPKARVPYSTQLKNLEGYGMDEVLGGEDGWNPAVNGNNLVEVIR